VKPIETVIPLEKILYSKNVAEFLTEQEVKDLGAHVCAMFEMDRNTRAGWEERMEKASKIALQVMEKKTFPWVGASNVKFPLITIAALQYHSRVYPALVTTPDIIHCATVGDDLKGEKAAAAKRVSEHMSWQLLEEDEDWEDEEDKALLVQPLMGTCFKKTYFNPVTKHNESDLVLPQDLVVSYYTKSVDSCPRLTHILSWSHNDLEEKIRRKVIFETETTPPTVIPVPFGQLGQLKDKSQGMQAQTQDPEQPFIILEQHHELDLDGDGYKEPYVSFVRYDNHQLLRILPRFLPSGIEVEDFGEGPVVVRIKPERFFTQRTFIPSPDGGFYGLGFGHLLGPLNESIDTSINQLFDAGTMHNAGGGFLGRGARFKSGDVSFRPNEWKRVESSGDDLRKSIVELPRREPSMVLFQLLSLLIDYGQRVAGAPDVVQGQNPGQNTPAETSRTMLEQGIKVFSGIYKRTYRALREEFKKLYRLNELYLEDTQEFISQKTGLSMKALQADYRMPSSAIRPAADPNYMSDAQRMNQANAVMQAAHTNRGYDLYQVNLLYLEAWKVPNRDALLPDPKGPNAVPAPVPEKVQIEQLRMQQAKLEMDQEMRIKLFEMMEEHDLNRAKILELEAKAAAELEQAGGVKIGHALALLDAQIGAARLKQEGRIKGIEILRDLLKISKEKSDGQSGVGGMAIAGLDKGVLQSAGQTAAASATAMGSGTLQ
jgi:chaperonin GroES